MDLQISVFLLFALFATGHSLSCYQCTSLSSSCDQTTCTPGLNSCFSATVIDGNSTTVKVKSCSISLGCPTGSVNIGIGRISSYCCSTDLCNAQDASDPSNNTSNGRSCYYCDGQSCSNTVRCSENENRCIKATGSFGGQSQVVKGCVSKSICDAAVSIPGLGGVSCCEGNLCNSAQSVTQSFLFLFCSLLSFILLH